VIRKVDVRRVLGQSSNPTNAGWIEVAGDEAVAEEVRARIQDAS
jgi:hypothetical protein